MAYPAGGFELYLSYSGRKSYLSCPKQYEYRYIKKVSYERDPKDSLFGSIIGKLFEWFYERNLWAAADPTAELLALIEKAIEVICDKEKWDQGRDPSFMATIRADLQHFVPAGIEVIRKHGLLTANSHAETDLTVLYGSSKYQKTLKLGGRCDFLHVPDPKDPWILDGKASRHREKYVDAEQLIWYAVQYYVKYRVAPTKLGFIFWKFPEDPMKWIAYDEEAMRKSIAQTFDVSEKIKLKMFAPTPSGECHRCDYIKFCDEGNKYLAERRTETGGGKVGVSMFDLESI